MHRVISYCMYRAPVQWFYICCCLRAARGQVCASAAAGMGRDVDAIWAALKSQQPRKTNDAFSAFG